MMKSAHIQALIGDLTKLELYHQNAGGIIKFSSCQFHCEITFICLIGIYDTITVPVEVSYMLLHHCVIVVLSAHCALGMLCIHSSQSSRQVCHTTNP